jgi:cation-transporting ATPase E
MQQTPSPPLPSGDAAALGPRSTAHPYGLSGSEALERRSRGEGNGGAPPTGRTYSAIIRENVFTFINCVLFSLGLALILLGEVSDAVVAVGVVLGNILVSLFQEVRAKHTLDGIALLTRPLATVLRDGKEQSIDPSEIVRGDTLLARPGDQIAVDGPVIGSGPVQLDESLLTGESEQVTKNTGDSVYSGTFCLLGTTVYQADRVGTDSVANALTARARSFRRALTPLQQEVNVIIRVILLVAIIFELVLLAQTPISHFSVVETVKMSVVIAKLVPAGLFLSITLAYALGALRVARQGALVQQVNAVESLSNVDVLCLDKTGTLTANRLRVHALLPIGISDSELRTVLGNYAASSSADNRTNQALARECPGTAQPVRAEISFSSVWKWSALSLSHGRLKGVYVLGAPEILASHASLPDDVIAQIDAWTKAGLRVLLFAWAADGQLSKSSDPPTLPVELVPLGLLSLSDELRPEANAVLSEFQNAGVRLKIISGDNPQTVAALARQAGFDSEVVTVSGPELSRMDEAQRARAVETNNVFGRITPDQKEDLVNLLRQNGHYVAMIGDGVNDLLSLKRANLAIAMQTGSQATRAVADIVLLDDSFASLPFAVREGQRIRNGLRSILKLFLSRVLSVALLLMAVMILGAFPFDPKHISVLTTLTVGVPSIALAVWAHPGRSETGPVTRSLVHFVLPAALTVAVAGVIVYVLAVLTAAGNAELRAQTALTVVSVGCGLLLIPFVQPPTRWWTGGNRLAGDWRSTYMACGLFLSFGALLAIPALRSFFGLTPLDAPLYLSIALIVGVWLLVVRLVWRAKLLERYLGVDFSKWTDL